MIKPRFFMKLIFAILFFSLSAGAYLQAQNCPVVDFGDDYCWYSGYAIPPYLNNNAAGLTPGADR